MTEWILFVGGTGLGAAVAVMAAWSLSRRGRRRESERLSRLAHDLRTPLSSVTAYAELLEEDDDPAARARFAGIILEDARRMDAMIGGRLAARRAREPGAPPPAAPRAGTLAVEAAPGGGTVLVVDDDRYLVEATRRLLARAGYDALGAGGGEEALAEARRRRPDLILMDLAMPGMDGAETLRRIRSDPATRGIPVILTTGEAGVAPPHGAAAVLTKPISFEALLAAVSRAIPGGTSR